MSLGSSPLRFLLSCIQLADHSTLLNVSQSAHLFASSSALSLPCANFHLVLQLASAFFCEMRLYMPHHQLLSRPIVSILLTA